MSLPEPMERSMFRPSEALSNIWSRCCQELGDKDEFGPVWSTEGFGH